MKISGTPEQPIRAERKTSTPAPSTSGSTSSSKTAATTATSGQTEKVQLSDLASRLTQLESHFSTSDFDVKKVNEVSAAIAKGSFKVDSGVVADKLLASVTELLGKKTQ